jgi:hypothetical protein
MASAPLVVHGERHHLVGERDTGESVAAGQLNLEPGLGYLSWSRLSKYSNCGEQYRLQYVHEMPSEPSGPALAGKAIHQTINEVEASEIWASEDYSGAMFTMFANHFSAAVDEVGGPEMCRWGGRKDRDGRPAEDYNWWISYAGDLFMRRYAAIRRHDDQLGYKLLPNGVELEIAIDLNGRHFVSYIDMLLVDTDGQAIIRDWKTGTMVDPVQLGVYSYVLEHSELGLTIDQGQIGYLRGNDFSKYIREYDLAPLRALVPRLLDDLIRGVEAKIFPLRPSPFCAACGVRQACEYGATLE